MSFIVINTDEAARYADQLVQMSRSALPVAIRTSLNSAAFDVKKRTLERSADKNFIKRSKNFFKANSKVVQAQGFDINKMGATVGMVDSNLVGGGNNYAVKDLQQQEYGGSIGHKSFIPLNTSRSGKSKARNVSALNRLSGINRIVDARKAEGGNNGQRFYKSVAFAGVGGHVLSKYNNKIILWRVNLLNRVRNNRTGGMSAKLIALYSYEPGRSVRVRPTRFMYFASMESQKRMPSFYLTEARKQITKLTGTII